MKTNGPSPAVYTVMVLLAAVIALNYVASQHLGKLKSAYEAKYALYTAEEEVTRNEIANLKTNIKCFSDTLKVKESFDTLSNNRFDNDESMKYSMAIMEESARYNIDPMLVVAIVATESSFRDDVVSHKGAIGLMQLLPSTAKYISDKVAHLTLEDTEELFDAEKNLRLGVAYLAYLIKKTGSTEHAIIAYNYGPVNLKRAINDNRTLPQKYVSTVMRHYDKIVVSTN